MWFRRLSCSFCRRSNKDVKKLVAGARAYIGDRCAREAVRIMETTTPGETAAGGDATMRQTRTADWNRTWQFANAVD